MVGVAEEEGARDALWPPSSESSSEAEARSRSPTLDREWVEVLERARLVGGGWVDEIDAVVDAWSGVMGVIGDCCEGGGCCGGLGVRKMGCDDEEEDEVVIGGGG